jgi:Dolichyl-phosphate-mannose-protein mannosyltransferase
VPTAEFASRLRTLSAGVHKLVRRCEISVSPWSISFGARSRAEVSPLAYDVEQTKVTIAASKDGMRLAAVTFVLHLAGNPHYGFFRDELYFIVCGRHPALGYVDQPPLVPLLAALSQLFGTSLVAIRTIPATLSAATTYTVFILARDMGGGRFAGLLAVICATLSPVLLAFGTLLNPDSTQIWLWPLAILFVGRALTRSPTWWLAAGAAFGLASLGKYSAVIAACALLLALAIADRRPFSSIRFWLGIVIGIAILLPNALWQWQHGLPMLELLQSGQHGKNLAITPSSFLIQQLILTNPLLAPVWIAGLVWCLRHASWRWFGIMFVALVGTMMLGRGKSYYPAPIYPALFAAGGVMMEGLLIGRHLARVALCSVCLAVGLALLL